MVSDPIVNRIRHSQRMEIITALDALFSITVLIDDHGLRQSLEQCYNKIYHILNESAINVDNDAKA